MKGFESDEIGYIVASVPEWHQVSTTSNKVIIVQIGYPIKPLDPAPAQ